MICYFVSCMTINMIIYDTTLWYESIMLVVLELGVNGHFSARTYGIHWTGATTWLGRANTVQTTFDTKTMLTWCAIVAWGPLSAQGRQRGLFLAKPPWIFYVIKESLVYVSECILFFPPLWHMGPSCQYWKTKREN